MDGGRGNDSFNYDSLAGLNGDRINEFTYDFAEKDRVVLTGLGITFADINVQFVGNVELFTITSGRVTYSITIDGIGSTLPDETQVFVL